MVTIQTLLGNSTLPSGISGIGGIRILMIRSRQQLILNRIINSPVNITSNWPPGDNLLDLTGLTGLTELICDRNNLVTLKLSDNTSLTTLNCANNRLIQLNLDTNTQLATLNCSGNPLTTITGLERLTRLSSVESRGMPPNSSFVNIFRQSITNVSQNSGTPDQWTVFFEQDVDHRTVFGMATPGPLTPPQTAARSAWQALGLSAVPTPPGVHNSQADTAWANNWRDLIVNGGNPATVIGQITAPVPANHTFTYTSHNQSAISNIDPLVHDKVQLDKMNDLRRLIDTIITNQRTTVPAQTQLSELLITFSDINQRIGNLVDARLPIGYQRANILLTGYSALLNEQIIACDGLINDQTDMTMEAQRQQAEAERNQAREDRTTYENQQAQIVQVQPWLRR